MEDKGRADFLESDRKQAFGPEGRLRGGSVNLLGKKGENKLSTRGRKKNHRPQNKGGRVGKKGKKKRKKKRKKEKGMEKEDKRLEERKKRREGKRKVLANSKNANAKWDLKNT